MSEADATDTRPSPPSTLEGKVTGSVRKAPSNPHTPAALIAVVPALATGLIARLAFKLNFSEICGVLAAVVIILVVFA